MIECHIEYIGAQMCTSCTAACFFLVIPKYWGQILYPTPENTDAANEQQKSSTHSPCSASQRFLAVAAICRASGVL